MLDIFKAYEFNKKKAISFGFIEENGIFKYSSLILENDFQMNNEWINTAVFDIRNL